MAQTEKSDALDLRGPHEAPLLEMGDFPKKLGFKGLGLHTPTFFDS